MKKITTILMLLMLTCMGAWAQVPLQLQWSSGLVPVTKDAVVASVGSGARYAFRMPSNTRPGWCDFVNVVPEGTLNDLTDNCLFTIEPGSAEGKYKLKRVSDGKFLSGNAQFDDTGMDLTLTNRIPKNNNNPVNDYDTGYSESTPFISFDDASGNHYNCGNGTGGLQFRNGTGGWSVYVAYGPIYKNITIDCQSAPGVSMDGDGYPQNFAYKVGGTITAPTLLGWKSVGDPTLTVSEDNQTLIFKYQPSTYDYTLVVNGAPQGTKITISGNIYFPNSDHWTQQVGFSNEVTESDVVVTFPTDYSYMAATKTIEGTTITVNCDDPRWPVNFPKTQTFTRDDRHINSASFNDQTVDGLYVNQNTLCYQDLTATKIVTLAPNVSVKPRFNAAGGWQHGFVYIDLNNDGDFTDEGELVAKSPNGNNDNPNLAEQIAAFTSPAQGTYRMRIKTDWASEDPGGNTDPSNYIIDNRGMIVDLTLQIIGTTAEQDAAFEKVKSWLPLMQNSMALVTDASNYLSNAKQSNEGSYADLLDKNNSTYFHSAWGGTMASQPNHDLQARLPEAVDAFHLFYVTRSNGTGYPQAMRIDGSNNADDFTDAAAGGATWTNSVSSLSGLPSGATKSYLSDKISLSEAYQYLRFVPDVSYKDTYWFCLAEFWLFPSNAAIDAAINMMKSVNSVYDITPEMITAINQIDEDLRSTTANVTYVVKDANGNPLFTSEPQTVAKGTTITTLPADFQRPLFYTYSTVNESITGNTTLTFTATPKAGAPFQFTADTSAPVWYYLKNQGNSSNPNGAYPTYVAGGNPNVTLPTANAENATTSWAFIGNPYSGFQIVNKAAGTSLILGSASTVNASNTGGNTYATLGTGQDRETWTIEASSYATNGFFIRNADGHALNLRSNTNLAYWTNGADQGSTFVATTLEEAYAALITRLQNIPFGTGLGQYSLTYQGTDYTERAAEAISYLVTNGYNEQTMVAAQQMLAGASLNMPKPGFYRIKGEDSQKYLATGEFVNDGGVNKFPMTENVTGTNTIFYFDGTKLINYGDGMANGMSASAWAWVYGSEASTVEFGDGETNGGYYIKSANAYFFDRGGDRSCADRGQSLGTDARYRCWKLEEVTELPITLTKVGDKYYGTFYSPVAISDIAGDCRVYGVSVNGNVATATSLGVGVPAGCGVLLIGDRSGDDATMTATATIGEYTGTDTETGLKGVTATEKVTAADGNSYTDRLFLGTKSGNVGFYRVNTSLYGEGDETYGLTGAFKAYLAWPTTKAKEGFTLVLDGGVTGVENIEHGTENGAVYNLQGQRVNKAQKGVYIQNGKKVVLK